MGYKSEPHAILEGLLLDLPEDFTAIEREQFEAITGLDRLKKRASTYISMSHYSPSSGLYHYLSLFVSSAFEAGYTELVVKFSKVPNTELNNRILAFIFRGGDGDKAGYEKLLLAGFTPTKDESLSFIEYCLKYGDRNFSALKDGLPYLSNLPSQDHLFGAVLPFFERDDFDNFLSILLPLIPAPTDPRIIESIEPRFIAGKIELSYAVASRIFKPDIVKSVFLNREESAFSHLSTPFPQGRQS